MQWDESMGHHQKAFRKRWNCWSPCTLARKIFLLGLEMTQTIVAASSLEQESLKRAGIYLSLKGRSAGKFGLMGRRKEGSGWEEVFCQIILPPYMVQWLL